MHVKKILLLCTGNSCRSQMAEGFIRRFAGEKAHVYSAGIAAHGVNKRAIACMHEIGIDMTGHTSNQVNEYANLVFDYVITVCDHAQESCPVVPYTASKIHQSFADPAKASGSEEEIQSMFRVVRDQIGAFCLEFVNTYILTN